MRTIPILITILIATTPAAARSILDDGGVPDFRHGDAPDYQLVEPDPKSTPFSYLNDDGEVVIYLNRYGGLFFPGRNDSRLNTSSLVDETVFMPPYLGDGADWNDVVDCVEEQFLGFRVRVTDIDPGFEPHFEAVVSGVPGDIGQGDHVGGISPFRTDCGVIDNSVVFVFADLFGSDSGRLCEIVAHEVAHSFGIDHQMNCEDPMSYLGGCGKKEFRNEFAQCGEYEDRECACGQEAQNSIQILSRHLGDLIAPQLAVMSPANGAVVNPNFYVDIRAQDNVGVDFVELFVDGERVAVSSTPPFLFEFNGELAPGAHNLEARVYDSENTTTEYIRIEVDEEAPMQTPPSTETRGLGGKTENISGGCSATGDGQPAGIVALALFCLGLSRRRSWRRARARR